MNDLTDASPSEAPFRPWRDPRTRLATLAVLLGAILYVGREGFIVRPLLHRALRHAESATGLVFTFTELETRGLGGVDLLDLRISDPSTVTPRLDGEFERLGLEIDPWRLLFSSGLDALDELEIVGGNVFVDAERWGAEDLRDLVGPRLALPAIDAGRLTLELRLDSARSLRLDEVRLTSRPDREGHDFDLGLAVLRARAAGRGAREVADLRTSGRLTDSRLTLDGMTLESVEHDFEALVDLSKSMRPERVRVDWPLEGGTFNLDATLDGWSSRGTWSVRTERLGATVATAPPLLTHVLPSPPGGLDGSIRADGSFDFDIDSSGPLDVDVDGRVDRAQLSHPALGDAVLALTGQFRRADGWIEIPSATLGDERDRIVFEDFRLPEGADSRAEMLAQASGQVRVDLDSDSRPWSGAFAAVEARVGGFRLVGNGSLAPERTDLMFDVLDLRASGAKVLGDSVSIELEGSLSGSDSLEVSGNGTLSLEDPSLLRGRWATSLRALGKGEVQFELDHDRGRTEIALSAELDRPGVGPIVPDTLQAAGRLVHARDDSSVLELETFEAAQRGDRLWGSASIELDLDRLEESNLTAVDGQFEIERSSAWLPLETEFSVRGVVTGSGPLVEPRLELGLAWSRLNPPVESSGARLGDGSALVSTDGRRLSIDEFNQSLDLAELVGTGAIRVESDGLTSGLLRGDLSVEMLEVDTFTIRSRIGDEPDILLELGSPLRVDRALLTGDRTDTIRLEGSAGSLAISRDPDAWSLGLRQFRGSLLPAELLPLGLEVERIDGLMAWTPGDALVLELVIDSASVLIGPGRLTSARTAVDGVVEVTDAFALAGAELTIETSGLGSSGLWPGDESLPAGTLDLQIARAEDGVTVKRGRLRLPERIELEMTGGAALDDDDGVRALDLRAAATLHDLGVLESLVPELEGVEGRLVATNIELRGSPRRPELEADLSLSDGKLTVGGPTPPLEDLQGAFRIEGERLTVLSMSGSSGAAPLTVGGSVELFEAELDLTVQGRNVLLHRSPELSVRADLDLALLGDLNAPTAIGQVALANTRYRRQSGELEYGDLRPRSRGPRIGLLPVHLEDLPFERLGLDLDVTARPDDPVRLATFWFDAALRPALRIEGTLGEPRIEGVLAADPTELNLPSARLRLPRSELRFASDSSSNPELILRAETRLAGYDITLSIEGTLNDPRVSISTVPPLSTESALALLSSGVLPDSASAPTAGIQTSPMLELFVSRNMGAQVFGNAGDADTGLVDRFEAEVGRTISRAGRPSIEVSFRMVDGVVNDSDSLYLTGERDQYEDVNGGIRLLFRFR